jgi:tetratricopeptide (TPR) repeat protein
MQSPREALELLEAALDPRRDQVRMPPDDRWKLVGRGRAAWAAACRAVGDDAAAADSLSAAEAVAAKHGVAEAVARACDELGEFAVAARLWEPLAASDPALLANLAVSRMQAGQTDAALAAFKEAVRRFPDDPGLRANLDRARRLVSARHGSGQ